MVYPCETLRVTGSAGAGILPMAGAFNAGFLARAGGGCVGLAGSGCRGGGTAQPESSKAVHAQM